MPRRRGCQPCPWHQPKQWRKLHGGKATGAESMAARGIGIIVEGATGRLGATQHLRSLMEISGEGGLTLAKTLAEALDLARHAERAGLKNGVVQDKLFLPGLTKLRKLYEVDFFGRVLSIRLDFGWWVFDGMPYPAQRPSWNYRKATGGGLILDMFAHWRYIFDRLLGEITAVSCRAITALPVRRDETGNPYRVDVEDTAFAIFELAGGVLAQVS